MPTESWKKWQKLDFLNNSSVGQTNRAILIHHCPNRVHLVRWRTSTMATSASRIRLNQATIAHKLCKNWTIHSRHMFQMQHEIISLQSLPRHHQTSNRVNKSGESIFGPPLRPTLLHPDLLFQRSVSNLLTAPWCKPVDTAALCSQINPARARLSKDYRTFYHSWPTRIHLQQTTGENI